MALERKLIEPPIVKGAEFRREATHRPDKPELPGDPTDDNTELQFPSKLQTAFRFPLRLYERITREQKIAVQLSAAQSRISEVADTVRDVERATQQITAGPDMSRPGDDEPEILK